MDYILRFFIAIKTPILMQIEKDYQLVSNYSLFLSLLLQIYFHPLILTMFRLREGYF